MAQTADEFFGELAEERKPKVSATKSAEDFFGDVAAGKEKPAPAQPRTIETGPPTLSEASVGGAEMLLRRATGLLASIPAGIAYGGAATGRALGLDVDPRETMANVQEYLTYDPMSESGQAGEMALQQGLQSVLGPVAQAADTAARRVGEINPTAEAYLREAPFAFEAAGGALALSPLASPARALVRRPSTAKAVPEPSPVAPLAPEVAPDLPPVASRAPEVLEMPPSTPRTPEAPVMPPRREGGSLEMPQEKPRAQPLKAEGAPRKAPYTELEGGEKPPHFVEETPTAEGGTQLGQPDQIRRAQILNEIGIEQPRTSAITGDSKAAATDYQTSKLDSEGGRYLSDTFDTERQAIQGYSERLVNETGGTPGLGQTETLARGQSIVQPLDDLKLFFDDGIRNLYKIAGERARGVPATLLETQKLLKNNKSFFTGTTEGQALYRGVRGRMQELELTGEKGMLQPATVEQAEQLKQYLNEQWKPGNSRLIRRLKDAIDDDVTKAAGEDIYASARALRATRGRILDDPKGIAKIMDAEGPEGINRSVPIERIADTLVTLPVAQFKHIVQTLRSVPEEIRPQANAALAEVKAQFANKIHEVGSRQATQWNAKGVSQYLNANSARMNVLFTPEEMKRFATLNDAGHILRFPASYPGAAVQAHNIGRSGIAEGIEGVLTTGGAGAGGWLGGPLGGVAGAAAGRAVGRKIVEKTSARKSLKEAQKRTTKISDLLKLGKEEK